MYKDRINFNAGQLVPTRKRKTKSKTSFMDKPDPVAKFVADLAKKRLCMAGFYEIYSATKIRMREKI